MLPLIASIGSGLLNFFGSRSANDRNAAAVEANNARNIASQEYINAQNIALARETNAANLADKNRDRELQAQFAQQGIRWRAADARAAGIHPLYAMGAQTTSYAPSSVGMVTPSLGAATTQAPSFSNEFAGASQDFSRAIHATRSSTERAEAVLNTSQALQLQNMGLQNELLRSQIAKINATINPPMPSIADAYKLEGQSDSGVKLKPVEIENSGTHPSHAAGAVADTHYSRTPTGWAVVPSKDVKERIEDQIVPEFFWAIRNHLGPVLTNQHFRPPQVPLPQGHQWSFNPLTQEYVQVPTRFHERFTGRR